MRVVSQDKTFSVDFAQPPFWRQSRMIYAKIGTGDIVFGQYADENRAREVFEDMHNSYFPVGITCSVYYMPVE